MLKSHCNKIGSNEWSLSGEKLVCDTAQGILIAGFANHSPKLFRCHISRSASGIEVFYAGCGQCSRDAKIGKKCIAVRMKEDILWFEVAMNDILLMGKL